MKKTQWNNWLRLVEAADCLIYETGTARGNVYKVRYCITSMCLGSGLHPDRIPDLLLLPKFHKRMEKLANGDYDKLLAKAKKNLEEYTWNSRTAREGALEKELKAAHKKLLTALAKTSGDFDAIREVHKKLKKEEAERVRGWRKMIVNVVKALGLKDFEGKAGKESYVLAKHDYQHPDHVCFTIDYTGCGHTTFRTVRGMRSYDRLGVEDSFYWNSEEELSRVLLRDLARIDLSRAYHERAIEVPGIGFTVSPEGRDAIREKLKSGRSHSFHPSGFGTGYVIVPNKRHNYSKASPALRKFFGVRALWIYRYDAD